MSLRLPPRGRCRAKRGGEGAEEAAHAPSASLRLTAPPEGEK